MLLTALVLMMSSVSSAQMCPPPSTKYCGRLSDTASAQRPQQAPAAPSDVGSESLDFQDQKLLTPAVRAVIKLTNIERAKLGLSALTFDPNCTRAAQDHATDTGKNRIRGHVGSDGSQLQERYQRYSSDFSMLSENWAYLMDPSAQTLTPARLVASWMASPGHKANILDPTAKKMGVGLYRQGAELYAVQCFMAPAAR